ncbi:MAG: hypothetical protein GC164_05135 [Phycisphaera sp.]|nr:hypothetical protein [Phycisphaera sp.]
MNSSMSRVMRGVFLLMVLLVSAVHAHAEDGPPRWPELSAEEQKQYVEELKAFAEDSGKKLEVNVKLYETKFFLFYSDLQVPEARQWASLLDKMYARLCETFGLDKTGNIWRGKALVFVFQKDTDYRKFETQVMKVNPGGSAGICHSRSDGQVVIAFYRQEDQLVFAHVLVHESVHGFIHRYRSPVPVVNWANEGLAETIGEQLVPSDQVKLKERTAFDVLKSKGQTGGMFEKMNIDGWQYGVASSLTKFMISAKKKGYVAFINGIKDGQPWRESLEKNFGVGLEKLVAVYGVQNKLGALKP